MTIKVAIYKSVGIDIDANLTYLAFIILPNGKYWDVRFSGATEKEAKQKAIELWESERVRLGLSQKPTVNRPCVKSGQPSSDSSWDEKPVSADPWASASIEMTNKATGEKVNVPLTEIGMYEKRGFNRS
jgi:hypothetical protein